MGKASHRTPELINLSELIFLCALFVVGFLVRLIYLNDLAMRSPYFYPEAAGMDVQIYYQAAQKIAQGDIWCGKEVFSFMPLYAYVFALFLKITPLYLFIIRIVQAFLGTSLCLILYFAGRRAFNKTVGVLAAIGSAFYAPFIFYEQILMPTSLTIFLHGVIFLYFLILMQKAHTLSYVSVRAQLAPEEKSDMSFGAHMSLWGGFLLLGILLGIGCLCAGGSVILALGIAGLLLSRICTMPLKKRLIAMIVYSLGICMIVSISAIRNYRISGDWVWISSHGGINFYIGNHEGAEGKFVSSVPGGSGPEEISSFAAQKAQQEKGRILKASEISAYWYRQGVAFIIQHPLHYGVLIVRKCLLFFRAFEIPDVEDMYVSQGFSWIFRLPLFSFGMIAPFSVLGVIFVVRRRDRYGAVVCVFAASALLSCVYTFVNARYRLLGVPFFILLGAYAVSMLYRECLARHMRSVAMALAGLVLLGVLINIPYQEDFTIPYNNLGTAYLRVGKIDQAIKELKKAIFLNPSFGKAHLNLGICYFFNKRYDLAIRELMKAKALLPHAKELYMYLIRVYFALHNLDKAKEHVQILLTLVPGDIATEGILSLIHCQQGNMQEAETLAKAVLARDPSNIHALEVMAEVFYKKGDIAQGEALCKKILVTDPYHARARVLLGSLQK